MLATAFLAVNTASYPLYISVNRSITTWQVTQWRHCVITEINIDKIRQFSGNIICTKYIFMVIMLKQFWLKFRETGFVKALLPNCYPYFGWSAQRRHLSGYPNDACSSRVLIDWLYEAAVKQCKRPMTSKGRRGVAVFKKKCPPLFRKPTLWQWRLSPLRRRFTIANPQMQAASQLLQLLK